MSAFLIYVSRPSGVFWTEQTPVTTDPSVSPLAVSHSQQNQARITRRGSRHYIKTFERKTVARPIPIHTSPFDPLPLDGPVGAGQYDARMTNNALLVFESPGSNSIRLESGGYKETRYGGFLDAT
jgi:hypothetical protein